MKKRHEANEESAGGADSGPRRNEREPSPPDSDQPTETERRTADLSLSDQLEAARAERDANRDLYLRAQAELQNSRRRAQKELDEIRLYQSLPLARDLLPALDNLHRALAVAETSKNIDELVRGVRMVAKQIEDALGRHQVLAIETQGKPFDPNVHQAIQQVPSDEHPPMTVVQEVERGFKMNDRVVRPATVIVSTSARPQGAASDDADEKTDASVPPE